MPPTQLKFTFANHDNAVNPIILDVTDATAIEALRLCVFERWPSAISKPDRAADVRLFCMGKQLESRTVGSCSLPSFDFPTPVHAVGMPSRSAMAAQRKADSGGCCIVM